MLGGGGSFLKSRAAANYFPCDSLRSLSRQKGLESLCILKRVWHAQQGFTGRVRDHGSVLIQDRGRRVWLLPHQLECISTNGKRSSHLLIIFCLISPPSSLCTPPAPKPTPWFWRLIVYLRNDSLPHRLPRSNFTSHPIHSFSLIKIFLLFPPLRRAAVFHLMCNPVMTQWDIEITVLHRTFV